MNLPNEFMQRTKALLGADFEDFIEALSNEPTVSLRKNIRKNTDFEQYEKVAWCNSGVYLPQRPVYTLDTDFHAGAYYVQEASSMFLEQVIKQYFQNSEQITALDLCAAPGGKSTHLLSLLPEKSTVVVNEIIRSRAKILLENIIKWGYPNAIVTNNDPKHFSSLNIFFDLIVVDAPCSGEGMFRKDNAAINEWSVNNVELCAQRQKRILADIWSALKPNGILVFCTCTYNTHENEEQIKYLINEFDATSLPLKTQAEWRVSESAIADVFTYRFYPHKTKGEGFCLSIVRKNGDSKDIRTRNEKSSLKFISKNFDFVRNYLINADDFNFHIRNDEIIAIAKHSIDDLAKITKHLNCLHHGISIGTIKGKDFIPHQSLANSVNLNKNSFPIIELDKTEALKFLRKDNISNIGSTRGYNLVYCNNNALGWIKNIGNRANNLYPQEWKIRMNIG